MAKEQTHPRAGEPLNGQILVGKAPVAHDPATEPLAALREILLEEHQEQVVALHAQIRHLQTLLAQMEGQIAQLNDPTALAAKITPSLAPAISISIRESRDSMIDALYPIMGKLVTRSVTEALRELVRRIDEQMRSTLSIKSLTRRVQARVAGVSEAELVLRDVLPFDVLAIFLIYHESGLLLKALSIAPELGEDSDLISGMLTAIRDFVADAFGRQEEGELNEVHYGDLRILIETAKYTYVAVVIRGTEPSGFRAQIREQLAEIEMQHVDVLLHYDGNAAQLAEAEPQLAALLQTNKAAQAKTDTTASPPTLPLDPATVPPVSFRLAPAVRFLLGAIMLVALLLLWRLWSLWQRDVPIPDMVVIFFSEIIRGTVFDYI